MLGLSASLLAGGVAKLLQPLPGPGQPANQSIVGESHPLLWFSVYENYCDLVYMRMK